VFSNLDQSKWVPILAELTQGRDPAALPSFRPRNLLDRTRQVVFRHEEFTLPDYRNSSLYNDFLRPLNLEQGLLVQLEAHGQLVGYYPLYRSSAMKPFDQDDRRFLSAAAPHIAHGLHAAKLINSMTYPVEPGAPVSGPGVVVMDGDGRIVGMDQQARSFFFQLAMHEKLQWSAFAEPQLRSLLDYVATKLRNVFSHGELSPSDGPPPAARILSHAAGIILRLTGYVTPGEGGRDLFVVLVEQIEPEALAQARIMYRHGLAPREAEMLMMLRRGPSVAQIAAELGISKPTAKTYVRNLIEKLGVSNLSHLRANTLT